MAIKFYSYVYLLFFKRSELLKTQVKKETLETEIELLENKLKLKRKELRNSTNSLNNTNSNGLCCSNSSESIVVGGVSSGTEYILPNRLNYSLDDSCSSTIINQSLGDKKLKLSRHNSSSFTNCDLSKPAIYSNNEVIFKITNFFN